MKQIGVFSFLLLSAAVITSCFFPAEETGSCGSANHPRGVWKKVYASDQPQASDAELESDFHVLLLLPGVGSDFRPNSCLMEVKNGNTIARHLYQANYTLNVDECKMNTEYRVSDDRAPNAASRAGDGQEDIQYSVTGNSLTLKFLGTSQTEKYERLGFDEESASCFDQ